MSIRARCVRAFLVLMLAALLCPPGGALAYELEGPGWQASRVRGAPVGRAPLQQTCQFLLGFRALYELIPEQVGQCIENERRGGDSINVVQATTRGLLLYRPADNRTSFSDGATTWVNGPHGLQSRRDVDRFDWESGALLPPGLWTAWDALLAEPPPEGTALASFGEYAQRWLAGTRVTVSIGPFEGAWAAYGSRTNQIIVTPAVVADRPEAAAAVLMHELRHAAQRAEGYADCVPAEVEALFWEAITWQRLTNGGVEPPTTELQRQENFLLRVAVNEGEEGVRNLVLNDAGYRRQCEIGGSS